MFRYAKIQAFWQLMDKVSLQFLFLLKMTAYAYFHDDAFAILDLALGCIIPFTMSRLPQTGHCQGVGEVSGASPKFCSRVSCQLPACGGSSSLPPNRLWHISKSLRLLGA